MFKNQYRADRNEHFRISLIDKKKKELLYVFRFFIHRIDMVDHAFHSEFHLDEEQANGL